MINKKLAEKVEMVMRFTFICMTILAIVYSIFSIDDDTVNWEGITSLFIALILFILPTIFLKRTRLKIPVTFQIFFLLFIFASLYLGEMHNFYYRYTWWDSMLHSTSAIMLAYIGFLLIFTLNRDQNIHLNLSPFFIALFSFCFAVAMGALWEIFEYLVDALVGSNMQKARNLETIYGFFDTRLGVRDTMKDMIENTIGALFVSVIGYYYCKKKMIKDNTFWRLKDQFIEDNPDLFKK